MESRQAPSYKTCDLILWFVNHVDSRVNESIQRSSSFSDRESPPFSTHARAPMIGRRVAWDVEDRSPGTWLNGQGRGGPLTCARPRLIIGSYAFAVYPAEQGILTSYNRYSIEHVEIRTWDGLDVPLWVFWLSEFKNFGVFSHGFIIETEIDFDIQNERSKHVFVVGTPARSRTCATSHRSISSYKLSTDRDTCDVLWLDFGATCVRMTCDLEYGKDHFLDIDFFKL